MKNRFIFFYFLILLVGLLGGSVFGQTTTLTPEPSPTGSSQTDDIQELKEKVASKVAELRKKNNRAVAGRIVDISKTTIKINIFDKSSFNVNIQEGGLTKYYQITGAQQKEIDFEDIEKNDYIIITGVINDNTITANSIFIDQEYFSGSGKISEINRDNYTIKVVAVDKTVYTINIETYTKQQIVNIKTLELERIGFTKIKEGDGIHFVAAIEGNEKNNEYSAEKILIVPQEYFLK